MPEFSRHFNWTRTGERHRKNTILLHRSKMSLSAVCVSGNWIKMWLLFRVCVHICVVHAHTHRHTYHTSAFGAFNHFISPILIFIWLFDGFVTHSIETTFFSLQSIKFAIIIVAASVTVSSLFSSSLFSVSSSMLSSAFYTRIYNRNLSISLIYTQYFVHSTASFDE